MNKKKALENGLKRLLNEIYAESIKKCYSNGTTTWQITEEGVKRYLRGKKTYEIKCKIAQLICSVENKFINPTNEEIETVFDIISNELRNQLSEDILKNRVEELESQLKKEELRKKLVTSLYNIIQSIGENHKNEGYSFYLLEERYMNYLKKKVAKENVTKIKRYILVIPAEKRTEIAKEFIQDLRAGKNEVEPRYILSSYDRLVKLSEKAKEKLEKQGEIKGAYITFPQSTIDKWQHL